MDYLLQTLELIYKKYRALIIPFYGLLALSCMFYLVSETRSSKKREYLIDAGFLNRQVEKIQNDVEDFKLADVPYINMACANYREDYHVQGSCKIINRFLEKRGY